MEPPGQEIPSAQSTVNKLSAGKPNHLIPGAKGHWLKGNAGELAATPIHQVFANRAMDFGAITRFRIWHKSLIILSNPETIRWMLKERPHRFRRSKKIERCFKELGVHGVFSAEGDTWHRQRQLMNFAFKPSQVKLFLPMIRQSEKWRGL